MVYDKMKLTCLFVKIKGSKTDQTCQEITLCVGRTYNELCSVAAVLAYLVRWKVDQGPLLLLASGQPITRQKLVELVNNQLNEQALIIILDIFSGLGRRLRLQPMESETQ